MVDCFTTFNTLNSVLKVEKEHGGHQWTAKELLKKEALSSSGISCTSYLRNASEVLEAQIESVRDTEKYFRAEPKVPNSDPMSAAVDVFAYNAVEKQMKCFTILDSV